MTWSRGTTRPRERPSPRTRRSLARDDFPWHEKSQPGRVTPGLAWRSILAVLLDTGLRHGIAAVAVGLQRRLRLHRQLVHVRRELVLVVQHLLVRDDLAGMGGE